MAKWLLTSQYRFRRLAYTHVLRNSFRRIGRPNHKLESHNSRAIDSHNKCCNCCHNNHMEHYQFAKKTRHYDVHDDVRDDVHDGARGEESCDHRDATELETRNWLRKPEELLRR